MIHDPSGRGPSARRLAVAGLATTTAVAALLGLLGLRYTGYFDHHVRVSAELTSTGDGLPGHADVTFRGLVVGSVAAVDVVAAGERQHASIDLDPAVAGTIPANVTARVIPGNVFGVSAIELVDQAPTSATLTAGAVIPEDTGNATVQLQTTLNTLRTVLNAMEPEKLGRVLATLSAALDPSGRAPGSTIERLDNWITQVHDIPGIGDLLHNLGLAATALSESAPDLVGVLADSVTTARTLNQHRTDVIALLAGGNATIDSVNNLFAANPDSGKVLVSGLDQLFGGIARDPQALADTAANLNTSLRRLQQVFTFGPHHQMAWKMIVSATPFQQYTAKDCPHYGDLYGPRCGGPTVPDSAPPQQYPPQMVPRWLDAAGPAPAPAPVPGADVPGIPGLPGLPGLPAVPGITAPAADHGPAPAAQPAAATAPDPLTGPGAVAALVGGTPNTAQLLLLGPVVGDATVVPDTTEGDAQQ
ncbi:MCE family protein [Nocardia stercoris]|uniref:MCE family protein n=1 Tax=Nocardia stercoris TaxID=2483361 RepID=A0A3M2KYX8_9NOCA|nr:MCE family protein [Nocardia stercoris]RMI30324.1 MCE family protein [Nocardia stercoris]